MSKKSPNIQQYQDAVWDFLLEHSDITPRGALFVKFHTGSRYDFEKRVRARLNGYHREDTRLQMTKEQKEKYHQKLKKESQVSKETRKLKWKAGSEERKEVFARLKALQDRTYLLSKYPKPLRPLINTVIDTYATARTKMIQWTEVVLCRLGYSTAARPRKK